MTIESLLKTILETTAWRMEAPALFSWFHVIASSITIVAAVFFAVRSSRVFRTGCLTIAGWLLIILEIYKQLFLFYVAGTGSYDWWFFPFQLCSVPMYLCILLPLMKGKLRDASLTFMADYTFISAIAALIYPEDFLRSYITLTAHGFIWHGILLFISMTIILSGVSRPSSRGFLSATILFLALSAVAIGINVAAEPVMQLGETAHSYAAMFYLNPYHLSPQLIVGTLQQSIGIPAGLVLYTASIAFVSGIIDYFKHTFFRSYNR